LKNVICQPASILKLAIITSNFLSFSSAGERHEHYGIPHGFSSRVALERYFEWFIWLKPVKDATGDASREKKGQAFTCCNG
ncbi:DUF2002 family protein, partial [Escherichia coli]